MKDYADRKKLLANQKVNRSARTMVRLEPSLYAAIKKAAIKDQRSISSLINLILQKFFKGAK